MLQRAGHAVTLAGNGAEGLEFLREARFDVVLMDCQMPVMDGYTATRTRRTLEEERKLKRVPIIAMTANAMAGDREKCLASGMDDYLSKPLNRSLLEQTIRKWLPKRGAGAGVSADPLASELAGLDFVQMQSSAAAPAVSRPAAPAAPATGAGAGAAAARPGAAPAPAAQAIPQRLSEPVKLSAPAKPAIDRPVFDELLDVMGEEFTALVQVYLEDTPKNLRILVEAADRGDVQGMIAPAHSLKSTSANLGALGLADIAKRIEHGARIGNLSDPPGLGRAALAEFQRTASELKQIMSL
jgi:CheY-like chemotaxis protein/HPt (histidine-containing phosphotransfer) domain-containing protein